MDKFHNKVAFYFTDEYELEINVVNCHYMYMYMYLADVYQMLKYNVPAYILCIHVNLIHCLSLQLIQCLVLTRYVAFLES